MILNQIMRIGEVELEDKGSYSVLVDTQKPYKSKYMLVVSVDFVHERGEDFKVYEQEYDDSQRYSYARGLTSGSSLCLSPTVNIKWNDIKNEDEYKRNLPLISKIINFQDKLVKMMNQPVMASFTGSIVEIFFEWLSTNHLALRENLAGYLFTNYIQTKRPKADRPIMVIFKINNLFPGEIKEFRDLYSQLSLGTAKKLRTDYCYICCKFTTLASTPFNIGFFTLDHLGFGLHFSKKKEQTSLQICEECDIKLKRGYNILETDLRFFAYYIGKGSKQQVVFHYLIPLVTDQVLLKQTLTHIRRAKMKIYDERAQDVIENIKKIQNQLKIADRTQKHALEKEMKKLRKKQSDYREGKTQDVEITDLFVELSPERGISYLDIYFKETDLKQNPTVKEIVNVIHITKERFEKLTKIFGELRSQYQLKSLRLWHLKDLIRENQYPKYLQALFGEITLNQDEFLKSSNQNLKKTFLAEIMEYKNLFFPFHLLNFEIYYKLLDKASIWRQKQ